MTPLSRCLPGIAILLTAVSSPVLAQAPQQAPDAPTTGHRSRGHLVAKSVDQGFAIVRRDPVVARNPEEANLPRAEIKLGTAHRIDRSIFVSPVVRATETIHAPR